MPQVVNFIGDEEKVCQYQRHSFLTHVFQYVVYMSNVLRGVVWEIDDIVEVHYGCLPFNRR